MLPFNNFIRHIKKMIIFIHKLTGSNNKKQKQHKEQNDTFASYRLLPYYDIRQF